MSKVVTNLNGDTDSENDVERILLCKKRFPLLRPYSWPFIPLYAAVIAFFSTETGQYVSMILSTAANGTNASLYNLTERNNSGASFFHPYLVYNTSGAALIDNETEEVAPPQFVIDHFAIILALGLVAFVQLLMVFFTFWSRSFEYWCNFIPATNPESATHAYVAPVVHKGSALIVPLQTLMPTEDRPEKQYYFEFQRVKFLWNRASERFYRLKYPVSQPIISYSRRQTLVDDPNIDEDARQTAKIAANLYGRNKYEIPIPSILSLYKEQMIAPFFVFQMFCVLLWCLDEHPTTAIFTGVMLIMFEGTVVVQRRRNLQVLRSTIEHKPFDMHVLRGSQNKSWAKYPSDQIQPGDVVIIEKWDNCPCDALLLQGFCVANESMLTGESTPHLKEAISFVSGDVNAPLEPNGKHKNNVVYAGTQIIQSSRSLNNSQKNAFGAGHEERDSETSSEKRPQLPPLPTNGAPAYVIRTGFETSQGRLMRTILFSSENVSANNIESFLFIGFLLVFAIVASWYVMKVGLQDPSRSRWKLFLNCTLIITTVVPPELPMELTLAVNNSLLALRKLYVFCTEPFRIPLAGGLHTCFFDKTGTLTSDDLHMVGVAGVPKKSAKLLEAAAAADESTASALAAEAAASNDLEAMSESVCEPENLPLKTQIVLAGCQSLIMMEGKPLGDPVEVAALETMKWEIRNDKVVDTRHQGRYVRVLQRYPFQSSLKRMAAIVSSAASQNDPEKLYVVVKGAPEVVKSFCTTLPENYDTVCTKYASQGGRVLALALRELPPGSTMAKLRDAPREEVEKGLEYVGLAVFGSTIKKDSPAAIKELRRASLQVAMITGDNMFTACYVARETHIAEKPLYVLSRVANADEAAVPNYEWVEVTASEEPQKKPFNAALKAEWNKHRKFDLCIAGDVIDDLLEPKENDSLMRDAQITLVSRACVFARVSPEQKEGIVSLLKSTGRGTLMCGDGTNDVGALRQADVGVALLNTPNPAELRELKKLDARERRAAASGNARKGKKKGPSIPAYARAALEEERKKEQEMARIRQMNPREAQRLLLEKKKKELMEEWGQADAPAVATLGDASIASPFTCKSMSVLPVLDIIRQGRCTLVSTHQMYRILAINSLVNAYTMSVLYFEGVKMGDKQSTVVGMIIAMCFLFISWSKPMPSLSKEKPKSRLFNASTVLSVLLQFVVHLAVIIYTVIFTKRFLPDDYLPDDPDTPFQPNLINTSVFLVSCAMQVSSFLVNYRGHPFMQSLFENRGLILSLGGLCVAMWLAALEVAPEWNTFFELVSLPTPQFRYTMVGLMAGDLVASFVLDRLISLVFGR